MNAREIFQDILLCDKKITLQFPDQKSLLSFKSQLQTAKTRTIEQYRKSGFDDMDLMEGRAIICEARKLAAGINARFYLGVPEPKPTPFKILSIEEGDTPCPSTQ